MKFWKRLRWIVSTLFIAVLLISWLFADDQAGPRKPPASDLRQAPSFNH